MAGRVLACLVLALLCTPTLAPAQGPHAGGGMPVDEKFTFPAGQRRVVIPFTNIGEHVVIPISVNGSPPLQVVFDTGMPSPGILLYRGTPADSIAFDYSPLPIRVGGAGGGGAMDAKLAINVSLKAAGLEVANTIAIVMPPTPQMSKLHDGIVGATFFANFIVTIDHDKSELVLEKREGFEAPMGASEVPLEFNGRMAYVKAGLLDGHGGVTPISLVLDLGAMHAVSLNSKSNAAVQAPASALATTIGRGMAGPIPGRVGRIAGLEVGGLRLTNLVSTFPDSAFQNPRGMDSRNGNLGSGFMGRFNVTLDMPGERVFMAPNRRFTEPFEWDMTGVRFDLDTLGTLAATEVLPGSPGALAGIAPGDLLVAVDGAPADARSLQKQRASFRQPGRVIVFRLRGKDGVERDVRVTTKRLV